MATPPDPPRARNSIDLCALLTARAVRVIEFEYHGVGKWGSEDRVGDVVTWLSGLQYTCFWQSNGGALSPFLPECDYEFHYWSNVVCVRDAHSAKLLSLLVPPALR